MSVEQKADDDNSPTFYRHLSIANNKGGAKYFSVMELSLLLIDDRKVFLQLCHRVAPVIVLRTVITARRARRSVNQQCPYSPPPS